MVMNGKRNTRVLVGITFPLLILVLSLLTGQTLLAMSEAELEKRTREISDGLRCPTCQAISVNDSQAAFSVQIREKVRKMLEEGQSEDDIKAYFVSRYGEWILRAPKKEGLGLVLWAAPFIVLLLGGGLIFYKSKKRASEHLQETGKGKTEEITDADRKRIERDLRAFEEEE